MENQKLTLEEAKNLDELLNEIKKSKEYKLEVDILDRISTKYINSLYNEYNYKKLVEYKLIEYHSVENSSKDILSGNSREIDKFIGFVKLLEDEQKESKESEEKNNWNYLNWLKKIDFYNGKLKIDGGYLVFH
ncbi:MAG: hypothetical protein NTU98_04360 [Bacteroidetes bacterium]|nr:hypothetical protein [Bacteroidota bacterium]